MKIFQRITVPLIVATLLLSFSPIEASSAAVSVGPQASATSFHFVFAADSRDDYSVLPALSKKMVTLSPVFGFFAGDLCGSFDTTCINNTWKPAMDGNSNDGMLAKTFVSRGNHDSGTLSTWQGLWDFQTMAQRVGATNFTALSSNATYSFDYGNSHFAVIDLPGGGSNTWTAAQIAWLDSDLSAAESRGVVHEFLFSHGPMYGVTSQHGGEQPSSTLKAVMNKHPLSAGFHGHEHVTQYTHVTSSVESGINSYQEFTMGRAGAPPYSVTKYTDWHAAQNAFADVAVNGNDFTVTVYSQSGLALFSRTFTDGSLSQTNVKIAGTTIGSYGIPSQTSQAKAYSGIQNGPVQVTSDSNVFTSERTHNGNGFVNEMMGFPTSQLTNEYWFPWYDNLGMLSSILVGNPSTGSTAHVTVNIAGTNYGPYNIGAGAVVTKAYPVMNGPVHVSSDISVFTSERVHTGQGFAQETMGYPNNQLTTDYWFPWYDNLGMLSWILVGNPSTSASAHVTINIAGTAYGPYTIGPGGRITPQFRVMNGPVHVTSDINVFTSERVHNVKGFVQETMGYPNNRLTTEYWFPWYDNLGMLSWILVGNPSRSNTAHVTIAIAGTSYGPYTIGPGGRITPQFGVVNGPVHVVSDINVFSSERVHTGQGFVQETMGYPNNQLTTEYWFPWYDNKSLTTSLIIGRP